ncbi:hypothetical protein ACWGA9_26745 [Streptomyces sp. NPDC054950]
MVDVEDAAVTHTWSYSENQRRLAVVYFANRALRHLSVLDVVWLG